MAKDLKVGDKVSVYGKYDLPCGQPATISFIHNSDEVEIKLPSGNCYMVIHPKQCRRLIKKKLREWTIMGVGSDCAEDVKRLVIGPTLERGENVTVREIKRK